MFEGRGLVFKIFNAMLAIGCWLLVGRKPGSYTCKLLSFVSFSASFGYLIGLHVSSLSISS
jgi:hypothetical protein